MRLLAKIILTLVTLAVLTALGLTIALNLYLQSAGVQEHLKDQVRVTLGMPVEIRNTSYTPWNGLRLSGITIPWGDGTPWFEARALNIHINLLPLFQHHLVISNIVLRRPVITWKAASDGRWELPGTLKIAPDLSVPNTTPVSVIPASIPPPSLPSPPLPPEQESSGGQLAGTTNAPMSFPEEAYAWSINLQHLSVQNGSVTLLGTRGERVIACEGITLRGGPQTSEIYQGVTTVEKVSIYDRFFPRKLRAEITTSRQGVLLEKIGATLGEGKLTGLFSIQETTLQPFAYSLQADIKNASLNQLAQEAGFDNGSTEGTLSATIDMKGILGQSAETQGLGTLELVDARLKPMDFLQQIGLLLKIEELQMLKLSEAKATYTIKGDRLLIDSLRLHSENLILTASGPIPYAGNMNLEARLLVNEKLRSRLKGLLSGELQNSEEPGYGQIPFQISGPINHPQTDLLNKIVGQRLGTDLGGFLKGFFQTPSSKSPPASH